jgi:hypothetical protein
MSEINPVELREFERYTSEFGIDVYELMDETKVLIEKTVLKNISDGGVCFVSRCPDLYSIDQSVFLHICMPGSTERDDSMECMATVIQMHQIRSGDIGKQQTTIGVCMDRVRPFGKTALDQFSVGQESGQGL